MSTRRTYRGPANKSNLGQILAVRGSVVDARFSAALPAINNELRTGVDEQVVVEVAAQLDPFTVRGMALNSTRGLARGAVIRDLGGPLRVPVGKQLLGRVLDVFGKTIDEREPIEDVPLLSIHQRPPPIVQPARQRYALDELHRQVHAAVVWPGVAMTSTAVSPSVSSSPSGPTEMSRVGTPPGYSVRASVESQSASPITISAPKRR